MLHRADILHRCLVHAAAGGQDAHIELDIHEAIAALVHEQDSQKLLRRAVHDGDVVLEEHGRPTTVVRTQSGSNRGGYKSV